MKIPPALPSDELALKVLASIVTTTSPNAMIAPPWLVALLPFSGVSPPSKLPFWTFSVPLAAMTIPPPSNAVLATTVLASIVTTAPLCAKIPPPPPPPPLVALLPVSTLPLRTFSCPPSITIAPPEEATLLLIVLASIVSVDSCVAAIAPPLPVELPSNSVTPDIVTSAP